MRWVALVTGLLVLLGGCTSPESTRQRAGGAGADVGNRGQSVELHGGSDPYWRTPAAIPAPRNIRVAASARTR